MVNCLAFSRQFAIVRYVTQSITDTYRTLKAPQRCEQGAIAARIGVRQPPGNNLRHRDDKPDARAVRLCPGPRRASDTGRDAKRVFKYLCEVAHEDDFADRRLTGASPVRFIPLGRQPRPPRQKPHLGQRIVKHGIGIAGKRFCAARTVL